MKATKSTICLNPVTVGSCRQSFWTFRMNQLASHCCARFAARQLTHYALPYGVLGVRAAVYLLAAFLSMFMNNSATIAPQLELSEEKTLRSESSGRLRGVLEQVKLW